MLTDNTSRQVQSVRTAFHLVNMIQEFNGATLAELVEHHDLAKSTIHNYLATLEGLGYVVNENGTYRLGLRFLTHGMSAKKSVAVQTEVSRSLNAISQEVSSPIWWIVEEVGRANFLEYFGTGSPKRIYGRVGKRSYLHTHAPGKAILAALPDDDVETIIAHHGLPEQTIKTTTDDDALAAELETIRENGYAVSNGEAVLGVESIGVAFTVPNGAVHAVGIFGYSQDLTGESKLMRLQETVINAVAGLEESLHGGGDTHV
ncbi:IclR family transcriptional regulator [Natrinema halophilum]|uniref:IclR family transcriptional regulator n=1 Tax=Natrinema halophilum TaxID=1699371 RepID=UPI001F43AF52|nr:IclR family transcriptional regulator [Natrinema halophilum]UHQ96201.1 IclR family transcriptional regulator [Natrinema halophilum]